MFAADEICIWDKYKHIFIFFFSPRNKLLPASTCHFDETPYTNSLFYASLNINKFRRMTFPFQQINWVPTSLSLRVYIHRAERYIIIICICARVYKMMKNNNRLAHVFWMKGVTVDNHVIYVYTRIHTYIYSYTTERGTERDIIIYCT